ncbi:MAG: hypothetical protein A3F68_11610 [Acidobacteria bacterium RIFCSPLOWO2_12_FULL_54_10]|nr:MAG: hypothetical protein A3F68_11610 [Acidobacteria bacterium RIFCSPLOWO2_12_FULL_54_10]
MFPLTAEDKKNLLHFARLSLECAVTKKVMDIAAEMADSLRQPAGAFVTLWKNGDLRGCVGHVLADQPLYKSVKESAKAAALYDSRFHPVQPSELPDLALEISVLSALQEIPPDQIEVGVHGIMITRGRVRGLLLPQVAAEHRWSRETFLAETCHKAGLPADAWQRGARIEVFTSEVFDDQAEENNR